MITRTFSMSASPSGSGLIGIRRLHRQVVIGAAFFAMGMVAPPVAAADRYTIAATPTGHQRTTFKQGVAALYDEADGTTARVREVAATDGRIALEVFVFNRGNKPINFGPDDVQINTADGIPLTIIPYEQLVRSEQKRQKGQRFWSRLAAAGRAMGAANAGTTYGTGSYSGYSNGQIGGTGYSSNASGTFSYSEQNPAIAAAAQRDVALTNQLERDALEERQTRDMTAYDGVLRINTIEPGTVSGGTVQFDVPKALRHAQGPVPLQMMVTVNGDKHQFLGQLQKVAK